MEAAALWVLVIGAGVVCARQVRVAWRGQHRLPHVIMPVSDHIAGHIESRGGVMWYEAPVPAPDHRCDPHTRGYLNGERVERCTCGAIRWPEAGVPEGGWLERNTRTPRRSGTVVQ